MDLVVLILQIVTILVSVGSLLFNLLTTVKENRKKNYIKVVTEQRLKNKAIIRDNVKTLLEWSNEYAIDLFDEVALKQCLQSVSALETVLKSVYPEDCNLLNSANELLKSLSQSYLKCGSGDSVALARQNLLKEYSIYDLADWKFIKNQSYGTKIDSDEFDKLYKAVRTEFDSIN